MADLVLRGLGALSARFELRESLERLRLQLPDFETKLAVLATDANRELAHSAQTALDVLRTDT